MLAARRMMIGRSRHVLSKFTGVSFSQGQGGDFRIWTWLNGSATSRTLASRTGGGGTFILAKSGSTYTGTLAGTTVVSWTDTGAIAQWGAVVGMILGPLASSTVDNFVATGTSFSDNFNRPNGPPGNGWTVGADGTNPGPLISSNALVNNVSAGANEACWIFQQISATSTDVRFDLSGAPNPAGGYCHICCGTSGLTI